MRAKNKTKENAERGIYPSPFSSYTQEIFGEAFKCKKAVKAKTKELFAEKYSESFLSCLHNYVECSKFHAVLPPVRIFFSRLQILIIHSSQNSTRKKHHEYHRESPGVEVVYACM